MAKKLNKTLVGVLTVVTMLLMAVVGFALIYKLPGADPRRFEETALAHEKKGEWMLAAQNYMRAFKYDRRGESGENAEWLARAARCLYELGEIARMREVVKQARVLDPTLKSAQELLTRAEFELARAFPNSVQWHFVLDEAARLIELDPELVLAQEAAGTAWLRLSGEDPSFKEKGVEALRHALRLDPGNVEAARTLAAFFYSEGRREDGDQVIAAVMDHCVNAQDADCQAELRVFRGRQLLSQGKVDEAVAEFHESEKLSPNLAAPHLALAAYWFFKGGDKIRDAETELRKAAEVDPQSVDAYLRLAAVYQRDGKHDEQVQVLEQGLAAIPRGVGFRFVQSNYARILMMKQIFLSCLARRVADRTNADKYLADAEATMNRAIDEVGPDHIQVRIMRGHLYREQGNLIEATRVIEQADKSLGRSRSYELKIMLADLYNRQDQLGDAERQLREAIAIDPRSVNAYILLGRVLIREGEFEKALGVLESDAVPGLYQDLQKDPDAAMARIECYRQLNQLDKIEREREVVSALTQGDRLREIRMLAVQNKLDEAEDLLHRALKDNPKDSQASILLAQVLYQKKDEEGAREAVEAALKHDPENRTLQAFAISLDPVEDPEVRKQKMVEFISEEADPLTRAIRLFDFYINNDEMEKAVAHLNEAEKIDARHPVVIENQFRLALRQKDWEKAEKYCELDAQLNLDGSAGRMMRGRLATARGDFARAIEFYKEGLAAYPSNSLGWTYLAEAYLASGRRAEAKETLDRAIRQNPANGFANRMLASLYLEEGDRQTAKRFLETARRSLPNDGFIRSQLQLIAEESDPKSGITQRESIRKSEPDNIRNLVALGRLYARTAQPDKAVECLNAALALKKDDLQVNFQVAEIFAKELERPGDGEAVLTSLLRNTEEAGKKARIALLVARFYQDLELMDNAERYYLLAANLSPTVSTSASVGEYYAQTNRARDALDWFEKARDLARGSPAQLVAIHRRIIQSLILLRDKKRAQEEIDNYIAQYPDDEQGLLLRGLYFMQLGDFREAERALIQQLEKQPDSAMALWQLGQLHTMRNRWQLAIDELQKAKAFRPDGFNYEHRIALARALIGSGRVDEGLDELKSALDDSPDAQHVASALVDEYLRVRPPRINEAENLVYNYMRRFPQDPKWPMLLGRIGALANDVNKAIEGYSQAVQVSRFNTTPVLSLLAIYEANGRYDEVINFVTKTLTPDRQRRLPMAVAALAKAYAATGRMDEANKQFATALALARDDFEAYRYIALTMSATLGPEQALQRARREAEQEKDNIERLKILMHMLNTNGKDEECLLVGDQIVNLADRDDDLLFGLLGQAIVLSRLQRFEDARKKYENILKLDPNNAIALNNLAFVLADRLQRPKDALPYAEKAETLNPRDANTLDTLGWVLARVDRLADAEGTLLRAIEQDPRNIPALYHLGMVYKQMGNVPDAKLRLEEAARRAEEARETEFGPKAAEALKELSGGP